MGVLFKLIIILVLVLFIAGQFTRDKAKRVRTRQNLTNALLLVIIVMMAFLLVNQLK